MYIGLHVKYPLFLTDFDEAWIFNRFSKNVQILNFMKIRSMWGAFFHDNRDEFSSRFI